MKKLLALAIFSVASFTAILIVFGKDPATTQKDFENIVASELSQTNPRLFEQPTGKNSSKSKNNSTEDLATAISQEIIARNKDGFAELAGQKGLLASNPQQLVDEFFEKKIGEFDVSKIYSPVDISKLKISANADLSLVTEYLKNFRAIVERYFTNLSVNPRNSESLKNLVSLYEKSIVDFYILTVPKSLAEAHQEQIRLLSAKKNIYQNVLDSQQDPLLAYLSIKLLPTIDEKFLELKSEIENFMLKNGIGI